MWFLDFLSKDSESRAEWQSENTHFFLRLHGAEKGDEQGYGKLEHDAVEERETSHLGAGEARNGGHTYVHGVDTGSCDGGVLAEVAGKESPSEQGEHLTNHIGQQCNRRQFRGNLDTAGCRLEFHDEHRRQGIVGKSAAESHTVGKVQSGKQEPGDGREEQCAGNGKEGQRQRAGTGAVENASDIVVRSEVETHLCNQQVEGYGWNGVDEIGCLVGEESEKNAYREANENEKAAFHFRPPFFA